MTDSPKRQITVSNIPGPDFTVYEEESFTDRLPLECIKDAEGKKRYSCAPSLAIECGGELTEGRALACRAYRGKFWSITLRCDKRNESSATGTYLEQLKIGLHQYAAQKGIEDVAQKKYQAAKLKDFLGYCPGGNPDYSEVSGQESASNTSAKNGEVFLNEIHTLCRALDEVLFGKTKAAAPPSGLVVITGATNSSKSHIIRGLIFLYLQRAAAEAWKTGKRRPHLVTFEDPIEKYYVKDPVQQKTAPGEMIDAKYLPLSDLEKLLALLYLDYTPREKGMDADNLKHVLEDALRQTPAVLFVGETREKDDWKDLLQFANTGHLVITTAHAHSVVEAMSGIFRDTDTKTPAQRSEIARRILGIINIRSFTPTDTNIRALLPALWKRTPQATNNLTADGLASILPAQGREHEIGYYGRTYFARKLTGEASLTIQMKQEAHLQRSLRDINKKAIEWDIEGV